MTNTKSLMRNFHHFVLLSTKINVVYYSIELLFGGWFLWVLFYVEMIWYFIQKLLNKNRDYFVAIGVDLSFVLLINYTGFQTGINLEIAPMALLFFLLANFTCKNRERVASVVNATRLRYYWFILAPVVLLLARANPRPVYMYINDYGNIGIFFVSACCGIVMTMVAARMLCGINYLNWIGKNSLTFYVFNFAAVDTAHLVNEFIKNQIPISEFFIFKLMSLGIYFVLIVLTLSILTFVCNKYLWFIFGKADKKYKR